MAVTQIDSVSVLTRSHYLPYLARLGPYDRAVLDRLRDRRRPHLVEYWAHEAALVPTTVWPLLAFRMSRPRALARAEAIEAGHPGFLDRLHEVVATHGPGTARELGAHLPEGRAPVEREHWGWNWSLVKRGLESLFETGRITVAGRTAGFGRRYAALEEVLPAEVIAERDARAAEDPLPAVIELLEIAARAHGLGTRTCLADYFRLSGPVVDRALAALVRAGRLEEVEVPGWAGARGNGTVYLHPAAVRPRQVRARALLSPFDPVVWQRARTEALWGMRYRIEIYTPAAQRVHGYYVLPFLLGEHLVARVDLRADRSAGLLHVPRLTWEDGVDLDEAGPELDTALEEMAGWLGLTDVVRPR